LRKKYGTTIILVTHNMGVAAYLSDRIGVMRNGALVELGPTERVIHAPRDDYTRRLLGAVIELDDERMAVEAI
ncbi:MAG: ABC transporter ATP-binding protein, partial [Oscillospiraceae bacterium]|nr:ABC transporter ATP-binding protein [Oscillospiraceae bacterium]